MWTHGGKPPSRWKNFVNKVNNGGVNTINAFSMQGFFQSILGFDNVNDALSFKSNR